MELPGKKLPRNRKQQFQARIWFNTRDEYEQFKETCQKQGLKSTEVIRDFITHFGKVKLDCLLSPVTEAED